MHLYINLHIHTHKQVHTQTRYNINLCWLVLCLVDTAESTGNREYKWRNSSTRLICGQDCGTFSGLMNDEKAQVTMGYANFGLMVLSVIRM